MRGGSIRNANIFILFVAALPLAFIPTVGSNFPDLKNFLLPTFLPFFLIPIGYRSFAAGKSNGGMNPLLFLTSTAFIVWLFLSLIWSHYRMEGLWQCYWFTTVAAFTLPALIYGKEKVFLRNCLIAFSVTGTIASLYGLLQLYGINMSPLQEALREYKKIVRIDPNYSDTHERIAKLRAKIP